MNVSNHQNSESLVAAFKLRFVGETRKGHHQTEERLINIRTKANPTDVQILRITIPNKSIH